MITLKVNEIRPRYVATFNGGYYVVMTAGGLILAAFQVVNL